MLLIEQFVFSEFPRKTLSTYLNDTILGLILKGLCLFWHVYFLLLIDWPWLQRHPVLNFSLRLLFPFSPGAKISMWHWGWGCCENTKENQNKYTRNRYIFHYTSKIYSEFEAEILGIKWEKYSLSFDTKKVLLSVETWGMRMEWEHTTLNDENKIQIFFPP